ncbi:MAG: hypothetical protein Q4A66_08570 [Eubacteriales bacterium]|nr:hypothetical protein [Eubacteriales bacterium]
MTKERRRSSAVSIGNWMLSLLLSALVPVLVIGLLIFLQTKFALPTAVLYGILAAPILYYVIVACVTRKVSKRNWAIANIIWTLIVALITVLVVIVLGEVILTALVGLLNTPVTSLVG